MQMQCGSGSRQTIHTPKGSAGQITGALVTWVALYKAVKTMGFGQAMISLSSSVRIAGGVLLLAGLSGCTYIIPEDASAPRYNTVVGARHKPERNTIGGASSAPVEESNYSSQSYTPPSAMPLPPVDPQVEAQAQRQMASQSADNSMVITSPNAQLAMNTRQVPDENLEYQRAQDGLLNVPPRPLNSGPGSASSRLDDTRRSLEQLRMDATTARDQLTRDAAAEPSITAEPLPPVIAVPNPPAPGASSPMMLTPPPPPPLPAQSGAGMPVPPMARSFDPMNYTPSAAAPALRPIQLTPPAAPTMRPMAAPMATARAGMPASMSSLPPTSSGFNPLAGAPSATSGSGAGNGYLPASRYTNKR